MGAFNALKRTFDEKADRNTSAIMLNLILITANGEYSSESSIEWLHVDFSVKSFSFDFKKVNQMVSKDLMENIRDNKGQPILFVKNF